MDEGSIISLVIKYNLYSAMIYICSRNKIGDFMTPLIHIYKNYYKLIKENKPIEA